MVGASRNVARTAPRLARLARRRSGMRTVVGGGWGLGPRQPERWRWERVPSLAVEPGGRPGVTQRTPKAGSARQVRGCSRVLEGEGWRVGPRRDRPARFETKESPRRQPSPGGLTVRQTQAD